MADLQTLNHYQISQNADGSALELARNESEVVCLGYDTENDHFVSFHVVIPEISDRNEFARRAAIAHLLDHPSLARLLDYGEEEDSFFYVTELVDGEALDAYLQRVGSIPKSLAADLAARVVTAILALQRHPDLIPATSTSSFRVFQDTPFSIRVILSEFLLFSEGTRPQKSLHITRANLQKNAKFLREMIRPVRGNSKRPDSVSASEFQLLLDEILSDDFGNVIPDLETLEDELRAFVPDADKRPPFAPDHRPIAVLSREMPDASLLERTLGPSYTLYPADDVAGRYAFETQDPGFGRVVVQGLPPARLCAAGGRLAVKKAVVNVNSKDHPHLLRALALWEGDYPCYIEEPVDSFSLRELCAAREPFQPDELFLLLQKLDVALVEAEAAGVARREIIPGDAFFTFFGGKKERRLQDLAPVGLDQWPDFQIKLRTHPTGEALAGRRTGMPSRAAQPVAQGRLDTRSFVELAFGLLGLPRNPSAESLADRGIPPRLTKLVQNYWLKEADRPNLDRERFLRVFGAAIAPGQSSDESSPSSAPTLSISGSSAPARHASRADEGPLGLAEALFGGGSFGVAAPGGLPPQNPDSIDPYYLTPPTQLPFFLKLAGTLILSAALAAAIAHVRGDAIWLRGEPVPRHPSPPAVSPATSPDVSPPAPDPPVFSPTIIPGVISPDTLVPGDPTSESPPTPKAPDPAPDPPQPDPTPAGIPPQRTSPPGDLEEALHHFLALQKESGSTPASPPSEGLASLLKELKVNPDLLTSGMVDDLRSAAEWGSPEAMVVLARRYLKNDPAQAFSWFLAASETGSPEAHLELGNLYLTGVGTDTDFPRAVTHFREAAAGDEPGAYFPLAECYISGKGVAEDPAAAVAYLAKGVEYGDPRAMNLLGVCYAKGHGTDRDFSRALELLTEAHARGNLNACGNLGALYLRGQGVAPDLERAASLFKEGALKGRPDCMFLYAQCLQAGTGVPVDRAAAVTWYKKSAREGHPPAIDWCQQNGVAH